MRLWWLNQTCRYQGVDAVVMLCLVFALYLLMITWSGHVSTSCWNVVFMHIFHLTLIYILSKWQEEIYKSILDVYIWIHVVKNLNFFSWIINIRLNNDFLGFEINGFHGSHWNIFKRKPEEVRDWHSVRFERLVFLFAVLILFRWFINVVFIFDIKVMNILLTRKVYIMFHDWIFNQISTLSTSGHSFTINALNDPNPNSCK